jgi:hypothetical protein
VTRGGKRATELKIMVSPVRIRVPPLIKVLQNAGFVRNGYSDVEVLAPQLHHSWLGEYAVEGVQCGFLHARHEVAVNKGPTGAQIGFSLPCFIGDSLSYAPIL